MEIISKEGKSEEEVLTEILEENNLKKEDIVYNTKVTKGKLFKSSVVTVDVIKKEDLNEEVKDYLKEVISNLGLDVKFEVKKNEEYYVIKMYSDNNPILIGKNGNTLRALEELCKAYVKNKYGIYYKISLDVENYRSKKEKSLERLAIRLAKEVKNTKENIEMDNMTSYERRIVHNALTNFKGVKTESEGVEPNRHVVIKPE